jgi:hypothetical protein
LHTVLSFLTTAVPFHTKLCNPVNAKSTLNTEWYWGMPHRMIAGETCHIYRRNTFKITSYYQLKLITFTPYTLFQFRVSSVVP